MTTPIKGGTLTLDFKNEDLVQDEEVQLKDDYYSKIKKSLGKSIILLNIYGYDMIQASIVLTTSRNVFTIYAGSMDALSSNFGVALQLEITPENKATLYFSEI